MANENGLTLVLDKREKLGTAECRRLRRRGVIPGNVYGHGKASMSVSVPAEQLDAVIAARMKVVDAQFDGSTEKVMFKEVQWDTFGVHLQHVDFLRVSADERVTVEIPVDLRGVAPGTTAGGVLNHPLHSLSVECLAYEIPESVAVRIGSLEIGQSIQVSELVLPDGVQILTPPETVVVQVVMAAEDPEEDEEGIEGTIEPEVIGRKAGEDSDEDA